jgi:hypothetical protein
MATACTRRRLQKFHGLTRRVSADFIPMTLKRGLNEVSQSPLIWYWKKWLPDRKGQACRIISRGKMNSALVEFEDGFKVITSRYAVRKVKNSRKY